MKGVQFDVNALEWIRSPEGSSFEAVFTQMELTECRWLPHQ